MEDPSFADRVAARCAAMPAAALEFPFGDDAAVYKVGGKIFALATVGHEPGFVTVKVDPEEGPMLREQHDFIREGYYMNKRHWITIDLTAEAPVDLVDELIEDSYRLVVAGLTAARRAELSEGPS